MANGIGFAFPFTKSPQGGFTINTLTIDQVQDDLLILLLTNYGERPMQYDFGANLRSLLFQQGLDLAQAAKDLIIFAINKWMPYVKVNNITIDTQDTDDNLGENQLKISIQFSVNGQIDGVFSTNITL
jgi:phage baseplate assembly protein W